MENEKPHANAPCVKLCVKKCKKLYIYIYKMTVAEAEAENGEVALKRQCGYNTRILVQF